MTRAVFHLGLILSVLPAVLDHRVFLLFLWTFKYSQIWVNPWDIPMLPQDCFSLILSSRLEGMSWLVFWGRLKQTSMLSIAPLGAALFTSLLSLPELPAPSPKLWETSNSTWVTPSPVVAWKPLQDNYGTHLTVSPLSRLMFLKGFMSNI